MYDKHGNRFSFFAFIFGVSQKSSEKSSEKIESFGHPCSTLHDFEIKCLEKDQVKN